MKTNSNNLHKSAHILSTTIRPHLTQGPVNSKTIINILMSLYIPFRKCICLLRF